MVEDLSRSSNRRRLGQRPIRAWRPWFWNLALWLKNGSIAVAFYLAVHTGTAGVLAVVAFIVGLLLRQGMEATSQGD